MSKEEQLNATMDQKIQYNVLHEQNLNRDTIKEWLSRDIKGIYIILADILRQDEILEKLTDVYYDRYKAFHAQKKEDVLDPFQRAAMEELKKEVKND